jgi:hypothetical protein
LLIIAIRMAGHVPSAIPVGGLATALADIPLGFAHWSDRLFS